MQGAVRVQGWRQRSCASTVSVTDISQLLLSRQSIEAAEEADEVLGQTSNEIAELLLARRQMSIRTMGLQVATLINPRPQRRPRTHPLALALCLQTDDARGRKRPSGRLSRRPMGRSGCSVEGASFACCEDDDTMSKGLESMDANGDGAASKEELRSLQAVSPSANHTEVLDAEHLMAFADYDGDGEIGFEPYKMMMQHDTVRHRRKLEEQRGDTERAEVQAAERAGLAQLSRERTQAQLLGRKRGGGSGPGSQDAIQVPGGSRRHRR